MRDEVSGHEPADFGDAYRFWRRESSIGTARGMFVVYEERRKIFLFFFIIILSQNLKYCSSRSQS